MSPTRAATERIASSWTAYRAGSAITRRSPWNGATGQRWDDPHDPGDPERVEAEDHLLLVGCEALSVARVERGERPSSCDHVRSSRSRIVTISTATSGSNASIVTGSSSSRSRSHAAWNGRSSSISVSRTKPHPDDVASVTCAWRGSALPTR
jgi:hypothetical protein